jgi:hypothetical protein
MSQEHFLLGMSGANGESEIFLVDFYPGRCCGPEDSDEFVIEVDDSELQPGVFVFSKFHVSHV